MEPLKPKPQVIIFVCPGCEAELELEGTVQDWAGQFIECPACQTETQFPEPAPEPESASEQEPEPEGPKEHRCPSCSELLPDRAVFCVNCGYNLKTGQQMEVDMGEKKETEKKESRFKLVTEQTEAFCVECGEKVYYGGDLCRSCTQKKKAEKDAEVRGMEPGKMVKTSIGMKKKPLCESCGAEKESELAVCGMCGKNPFDDTPQSKKKRGLFGRRK